MSQALALVRPTHAEAAAADELGRFAPTEPLSWHFAQGRYADERGLPALTRLLARLDNFSLRVWHRHLGNPKLSREGRLVLPLLRVTGNSRAEVRSHCRTNLDYVYAMPHGTSPLDVNFGTNPTLCRPLAEAERDAEHARLYAGADLRAFTCSALFDENRELRKAFRLMEAELLMLAGDG